MEKKRVHFPKYLKFGLCLAVLLSGPFSILPQAEVEGILEQIYADEGDAVEKGMIIARQPAFEPVQFLLKEDPISNVTSIRWNIN